MVSGFESLSRHQPLNFMSSVSAAFDNLEKWWSPKGLLVTQPTGIWHFQYAYAALTLACFVIALVVVFLKINPKLKARINGLLITNGFIGLVLYFSRTQELPVLGMDGLRFLQEISIVFWANSIIFYSRTHLKKEVIAEKARQRFEKYLPKK
jgi:hypothetical protein